MYVRKTLQRKRRSDLDNTQDEENAWRMSEATKHAHGVSRSVEDVTNAEGQPLDEAARTYMEPRFGHDFSQVRIHADDQAAASAASLNAAAYTAGDHVVFGSGRYQPEVDRGRELLGHELTHVIQQSSGAVAESPSGPTVLDDPSLERDAEVGGSRVATGQAVPAIASSSGANASGPVQRKTIQAAPLDETEEGAGVAAGGAESEGESVAAGDVEETGGGAPPVGEVAEMEHQTESAEGGDASAVPASSSSQAAESGGDMPSRREEEQSE